MAREPGASPSGELVQGTLDMLILETLSRGPLHGYAIAAFIERASEEVLRVEEGALYPALHRLELRGLLAAEWGASENNRRAKFYRLTAAGRRQLADETSHWVRVAAGIARIMETARGARAARARPRHAAPAGGARAAPAARPRPGRRARIPRRDARARLPGGRAARRSAG